MALVRFNFRNKLLILFLIFLVFPLIGVAGLVSLRVQNSYQDTLKQSFERNGQIRQQIVLLFLENYKSWARSIASQDILLDSFEELLAQQNFQIQSTTPETITREKLFSSLTSLKRENPFIERVYIADPLGKILVSTATNDIGAETSQINFINIPLKTRKPYYGQIFVSPYQKRVIPLAVPLIRKSDNTGFPLTTLKYHFGGESINSAPVTDCINNNKNISGIWKSYNGVKSLGVSKCIRFDDLVWTLVVEQPLTEAFAVSRQLGITIILIAAGVGLLLLVLLFPITQSVTKPLQKLISGAQFIGNGQLDYRINLKTGDELEDLSQSFDSMASKLSQSFNELRKEKETLQVQKIRLDQTARLLLRRDMELQKVNEIVEQEKESVEAEKNKLKVILEGITDGVIAVDLQRNILTINKSAGKIIGCRPNEILGKNINEVLKVYDQNDPIPVEIYCPVDFSNYEGVLFAKSNLHLIGVQGKEAYINLTSGKIKEGGAIKLGCIITLHDITEERELEKMKLDFVSMAAHELRAPLTTIQGYLSFLRKDDVLTKLTDKEKEYVNRASLSSTTLNKLIENLMVVSRIEEGKIEIDLQKVQISELIVRKVTEFKGLAETKGLLLEIRLPEEKLPLILADSIRIEEVLSNLINNAINYTQNGKVTVSAYQQGKYVVTAVKDSGQGIPESAIHHLFTKFFRVKGSLEKGSKGTGLGLYISKNIITAHKGKIWVESQPDEGSTFYFSLPIAEQEKNYYNVV